MKSRKAVVVVFVAAAVALGSSAAFGQELTNVPSANPKVVGVTNPTVLSPELAQVVRAQGSMPVENPGAAVKFYGYLNDQPNLLPALGSNVEATKTESDKNTYLVLRGLKGADHRYDYGTHFMFQGHEVGTPGQITRINLDADAAHRVTVLATTDTSGAPLPTIDGSTWYPFSGRLLFTQEGNGATTGGVWQATPDFPSTVESLTGILGRGGYEGIQADSQGNIWIVEDIGGTFVEHAAKVPNSFVYRFTPKNKRDLRQGGKLQALQVMSKANPGHTIAFNPASALTQDVRDLHTYGNAFHAIWMTIHDTDVDGTAAFNANALAKAKLATPFKRPENGQFRPGSGFREFFFDETGDTDATTAAGSDFGGFGGVVKLTQEGPSSSTATLTLFFLGDLMHTGFDNVAFWDENRVVFVEDRGDTLHAQGNVVQPNSGALDSGWLFDTTKNYADPANQPIRVIAQGRDPSATIDSGLSGTTGFQNEGDNEITGIHVSDGDAGTGGLLGAKIPSPFNDGWRVFYTQQHGDNTTYEIIRGNGEDRDGDGRRR